MIIIILGALLAVSCKKSTVENPATFSKNITGKWKYTQAFYSEGGPLIYTSTAYLNQWVVFNTDSSFSSNLPAFKDFTNYTISDSVTIKFTAISQPERLYFYHIDSLKNSLSLSPRDFICIEGCGDIFKR